MSEFYNITEWSEKPYFQTGGTRNKVIVQNPETGDLYYFKTSLQKEQKDYKHEFWSEIIASYVGTALGFDLLKYDIAFNRGEIGCISKSMVEEGKNKLTEGISYLTGFDTTYAPEEKISKKQYTFQLINKSLKFFRLEKFIHNLIEIIVFDSIIGNGDRHQENWGIITDYDDVTKKLQDIARKSFKSFGNKLLFNLMAITAKAKRDELEGLIQNIDLFMPGEFSQIYDSGSCLGRELKDDKMDLLMKDTVMMEAYIRRGQSEIHWEGEKLNHFELISQIKDKYSETVVNTINKVKKRYESDLIASIINNIDTNVPEFLKEHKLPGARKDFIIKLITLRLDKLFEIIR